MRCIEISQPATLDNLAVTERPDSVPGFGEILVKWYATSLNYHDLLVANGSIPVEDKRIPMADGAGEIVEVDTGERFWVDEGALYAVNEKARALSLDLPTVDEDRLKELTETLNDECCLIGWMEVEPRSERVPWWKGFWSFLHDPNIWESPPCEEGQENMIANYILRNDWEAWHDLFAYVENGTAYHTPTGAIIWYKDGQGHAVNEQAAMEFPELPEAPTTLDRKKVETRLLEEFRDCVESAATVPWPNDYLEGSKENFDLCFKDNPDAIRAIYGNACCDVERCE